MGSFVVEQGWIELYDQEGACAHLSVGRSFVENILPKILKSELTTKTEFKTFRIVRLIKAIEEKKAVKIIIL